MINLKQFLKTTIIMAIALLSTAALANGTTTVTGTIYVSGNPVSGGKIIVSHKDISNYTGETIVDGTGSFLISSVPLGDVVLHVYSIDQELMIEKNITLSVPDSSINVPISIN